LKGASYGTTFLDEVPSLEHKYWTRAEVYDSFTVLYSLTRKAGAWNSYAAGDDFASLGWYENIFRISLSAAY
jgi:hypothetical protein